MGLFDFIKKKENNKKKELKQNFDSAQIVERLEELGYFKYADSADIAELKKEVETSLSTLNYLSTLSFDHSPYNSKEYRHYHFDGEDLFEEGGFIYQLNAMKTLFDKMSFKLEISNHIEEWDMERGLNHSITLNGTNYIIFKNFNGYGWGEAPQRFAEIINEQLELQNKDERLFLANGANSGQAILLTEEQFLLLDPILKGDTDRPLRIEDWCRVMQVDRKNYCQE